MNRGAETARQVRADSVAAAMPLVAQADVIFPAVHGFLGEDGTLAALCALTQKPVVGSGLRAGAIGMGKWATKLVAEAIGIRTALEFDASHVGCALRAELTRQVAMSGIDHPAVALGPDRGMTHPSPTPFTLDQPLDRRTPSAATEVSRSCRRRSLLSVPGHRRPPTESVDAIVVVISRSAQGTAVTAAHDNSDLHELIDRLEPEQAEELRRHTLRLAKPKAHALPVLRTFDRPATDLGARAKDLVRAEIGDDRADR